MRRASSYSLVTKTKPRFSEDLKNKLRKIEARRQENADAIKFSDYDYGVADEHLVRTLPAGFPLKNVFHF